MCPMRIMISPSGRPEDLAPQEGSLNSNFLEAVQVTCYGSSASTAISATLPTSSEPNLCSFQVS
jgi:hypothetical protein